MVQGGNTTGSVPAKGAGRRWYEAFVGTDWDENSKDTRRAPKGHLSAGRAMFRIEPKRKQRGANRWGVKV